MDLPLVGLYLKVEHKTGRPKEPARIGRNIKEDGARYVQAQTRREANITSKGCFKK